MAYYESRTLSQLSGVLDDICQEIQFSTGEPIGIDVKNIVAKRIFQVFEAGIVDRGELKRDVLGFIAARQLWLGRQPASSQLGHAKPLDLTYLE